MARLLRRLLPPALLQTALLAAALIGGTQMLPAMPGPEFLIGLVWVVLLLLTRAGVQERLHNARPGWWPLLPLRPGALLRVALLCLPATLILILAEHFWMGWWRLARDAWWRPSWPFLTLIGWVLLTLLTIVLSRLLEPARPGLPMWRQILPRLPGAALLAGGLILTLTSPLPFASSLLYTMAFGIRNVLAYPRRLGLGPDSLTYQAVALTLLLAGLSVAVNLLPLVRSGSWPMPHRHNSQRAATIAPS